MSDLDVYLAQLAGWLSRFYEVRVELDRATFDQADDEVGLELYGAWETLAYLETYPRPLRIGEEQRAITDDEIADLGVGVADTCKLCFDLGLDASGAEVMRLRRTLRRG
jgi:hypothetical protein